MSQLDRQVLEEHGLISKKTHAIYDYAFILALQNMPWNSWYDSPDGVRCQGEYLEFYPEWISQSRRIRFWGLERFSKRHLINGTTQTFDESYLRYSHRRLRFFKGEYAYHRRVFKNWAFIEDYPLEKNDFIIVSAPFCSTGEIHSDMQSTLKVATAMKIPVIIDCAYFGTCESMEMDLSEPCIESVSFSLSKGLGLGDIRSGIRFSNWDDDFPIAQQNRYQHTIQGAAKVGLYMMQQFHPDFIPDKYAETQKQVCDELGLRPTPCLHLALGNGGREWKEYLVDGIYQRVGIRQLVKARFKKEI